MAKLYDSKCYCTNIRRSANVLTEYYNKGLEDTGLSVAQYYLLINLKRMERANITHWAERVGLDRSTMVRNIKNLTERKLIFLTEGQGKTYALTDKGKDVVETAAAEWERIQKNLEVFLGPEDSEAILRIGRKLQELRE